MLLWFHAAHVREAAHGGAATRGTWHQAFRGGPSTAWGPARRGPKGQTFDQARGRLHLQVTGSVDSY